METLCQEGEEGEEGEGEMGEMETHCLGPVGPECVRPEALC